MIKEKSIKGRKFRRLVDEKNGLVETFCSWNTTGKPLKRAKKIGTINSVTEE